MGYRHIPIQGRGIMRIDSLRGAKGLERLKAIESVGRAVVDRSEES